MKIFSWTRLNSYKPSILFVRPRQTVQTHIRPSKMRRLIRDSLVCLQNVLLKFELKMKNTTQQNKKEGKDQELIHSSIKKKMD